ncbi:hypothetical protein BVC80_1543g65 [Macleaya cordata]|uniref:Thioredoxin-like fold n=1 Tax=Macleaya cordata TaxID=56857 RepID=A0A200R1R6_MACCD|nr:hypothetical protein BVC80_1543g65 [Macleaya cordata]
MEISGVVNRPLPCFSGAGFDTHSSKPSFCCLSFDAGNQFPVDSKISVKPRKFPGISTSGFSDQGHLQYYVSPKSGTKKKEKKNLEMATIKKKLKLVKGLSKDLSMFSSLGFGLETEDGLISEVKGKNLSEASEILLAQLQLLKAEEKEMKRKKKEEKARLKAIQMKTKVDCESSSSSSESSDSECGEVVNMSCLRSGTTTEPKVDESQETVLEEKTSTSPISLLIQEQRKEEIVEGSSMNSRQDCCTGSSSTSCSSSGSSPIVQRSEAAVMASSSERIEVCMGGKCKKSGAAELLEEFEKKLGIGGGVAVVGCKCMGKCRDGPNVRVLNQCNSGNVEQTVKEEDVVRSPLTNPLCVGVGLEDVGLIVANFFGDQERKDMGLMAA